MPSTASPTVGEMIGPTRKASPTAILASVGFAVFVAADDLTVVTTMLRPIINDLGISLPDGLDDAAWIVNVYLIAFVAVMPLAGRLSDVLGRRRLFLGAYVIFLIGTIVIPLTSSLAPFLVGRVLTAIGGGAMVPVALAVVADAFGEARRARALGSLGAIETLGWVWGPLYGAVLVRFLDWRWQFWLNIPLAIVGMALVWWALRDLDEPDRSARRVDWLGATSLGGALVALNLALLGNAEIQSVSGLEQLQGGSGFDFRLLFPVAFAFAALFVWQQRRAHDPLVDPGLFRGRTLRIALLVNFVVGAALVIAMVDVPIFVNAIELEIERSAVIAGWLLAALTSAMAVASWVGGRLTERLSYRVPIVAGLLAAAVALLLMGLTWDPEIGHVPAAAQLGMLGAGLGLVFAPTTAAVVDNSARERRGGAAAIVLIVRLIGLSVGLAALTAWGLARFNTLRSELELPPFTDPGFQQAITDASARLTAESIAETFYAAAVFMAAGLVAAFFIRNRMNTEIDQSDSVTGDTMTSTDRATVDDENADLDQPAMAMGGQLTTILAVMAVALLGLMVAVIMLVLSLRSTQNDLAQTRLDLERVEQGAAGSAIVTSQVLEIARQLGEIEPQISDGFNQAITELENFGTSSLEFQVAIDETVSFATDIVIQRDFSFPINETIAIDQTVDTTIQIDTGLGFRVPVDVTVPVQVDVPIDLEVDVPINETVPVEAEVPVKLDVPIRVDVADTELSTLAEQLAEGLRQVQALLAELSF